MAVNVIIRSMRKDQELALPSFLLPGMCYGVMDNNYCLQENVLGKYTVVFDSNNICRGFEFASEPGEIALRLSLPSGWRDIHFFYNFIKKICHRLQTMVFERDGEEMTLARLDECIRLDIKTSERVLLQMLADVCSGKYLNLNICGVKNPISLDEHSLRLIGGDTRKFDNYLHKLQSQDLYYAKANVYKKKDGELFGVYVLTADVASVLPYDANLCISGQDWQLNNWYVGLVFDGRLAGSVPYQALLAEINKQEWVYDAQHFIICLSKRQMQKLLLRARVEI